MFDGPVVRLFPEIHAGSLPETTSFAANVLRVLSSSPLIQSSITLSLILIGSGTSVFLHLFTHHTLLIPTLFLVSDHHID
jgi:hypothetical protein